MTRILEETINVCDQLFKHCDIDYIELRRQTVTPDFFDAYENTRIVNSFLFNFAKLQDKIGAKLFKTVLYELKEIDDMAMPMIDVLNLLEKLNIIADQQRWEELRELRNILSHEYPFDIEERIENIQLALDGYSTLKTIYQGLIHALNR
jgi:hypothetical protein